VHKRRLSFQAETRVDVPKRDEQCLWWINELTLLQLLAILSTCKLHLQFMNIWVERVPLIYTFSACATEHSGRNSILRLVLGCLKTLKSKYSVIQSSNNP
jgi:hypothetical protein